MSKNICIYTKYLIAWAPNVRNNHLKAEPKLRILSSNSVESSHYVLHLHARNHFIITLLQITASLQTVQIINIAEIMLTNPKFDVNNKLF